MRVFAAVLLLCLVSGCASHQLMTESTKRNLIAQKCEEKIRPLIRFAALFTSTSEPDKKVCACIAQRIELARVEALVDKPAGQERDAAVAGLLMENAPMIAQCARETGVLK